MAYQLPLNQCLALARRAMMDAAYENHMGQARDVVIAHQDRARSAMTQAVAAGWAGDVDEHLLAILNSPDCDFRGTNGR